MDLNGSRFSQILSMRSLGVSKFSPKRLRTTRRKDIIKSIPLRVHRINSQAAGKIVIKIIIEFNIETANETQWRLKLINRKTFILVVVAVFFFFFMNWVVLSMFREIVIYSYSYIVLPISCHEKRFRCETPPPNIKQCFINIKMSHQPLGQWITGFLVICGLTDFPVYGVASCLCAGDGKSVRWHPANTRKLRAGLQCTFIKYLISVVHKWINTYIKPCCMWR